MWNLFKKAATARQAGGDSGRLREAAQPAAAGVTVCCGEAMEQRLARARDRYGQVLSVSVWHCPKCGRTRL